MADSCHIAKCWKRYNSHINGPIWMKLGWSHPIMSPTCPPWWCCHGNGCWLAMLHCTFSRYWRLEAERVNQFCWNLVYNSKLGPQWRSRDTDIKIFKIQNSTAHWTFSSYGRLEAERVNQFWWNLVYNSKFGQQWQSRGQICDRPLQKQY